MDRRIGTKVMGIRCPIIKEGDDLSAIVVDSIFSAKVYEGFSINDRDIIAVTESIVARAQGNYATVRQIAEDVKAKFGENATIGVILPITSRNRFAVCLKGIAVAAKKIVLMFSYPTDEVGNALIAPDKFLDVVEESGINPYIDVLSLERYRELFGYNRHEFTGVDYIDYYGQIIEEAGSEVEIIFANQAKAILNYTDHVLNCDIHTRKVTKNLLLKAGAKTVYSLDDILTESVNGSGYNPDYGLLGSNKATDDKVKLFPRDCKEFIEAVQAEFRKRSTKRIEVMVYGDGAFKDPRGKIWELADPVVSPAFTDGLRGTPNELKLKYLADNDFKNLHGEELQTAVKTSIKEKDRNLVGKMSSQGTTPRQLSDLVGSLADLTSGSGDKGTPVVLIQGYFDNYAN